MFSITQVFQQCDFTTIESNCDEILAKSAEQEEHFVTVEFNFLLSFVEFCFFVV